MQTSSKRNFLVSPSKWTISPSSAVLIGPAAPWLIVLARVEVVLIRHGKLGMDEVISDDRGNYGSCVEGQV